MFIKVGKEGRERYINTNHIVAITCPGGDPEWIRYEVILTSGDKIILYQDKKSLDSYMPREKLIEKLKLYTDVES